MSLESLDTILNRLENGIIIISQDLSVKYWNRWLEINTQIYKDDILDKELTTAFPGINRLVLERKIKTSLELKISTFYENSLSHILFPIERQNIMQTTFNFMQLKIIISPYDIEKKEVLLSLYDISEVYELKHTLLNEIEKISSFNDELWRDKKLIQDNTSLIKIDKDGKIIEISSNLLNLLGYEDEELINTHISVLFHTDIEHVVVEDMFSNINDNIVWKSEVLCKSKYNRAFWVDIRAIPFLNDLKSLDTTTLIFQTIRDKKRLEKLLFTDPLTKTYNRVKYESILKKRLELLRKGDSEFSLLLIDIDNLKTINDTYGYRTGDNILIKFSQEVKSIIRDDDLFMRVGSSEFILILKYTSLKDSILVAEKIKSRVRDFSFENVSSITISFGVTGYQQEDTQETIFERVQQDLYKAKTNESYRVTYHE